MGDRKMVKKTSFEDSPVARNLALETQLCKAIKARVLVQLRYKDDVADRLFEPFSIYITSRGKFCVDGSQKNTANNTEAGPHNFEVGHIRHLKTTDTAFVPPPSLSSRGEKYRHGVLCAVDR